MHLKATSRNYSREDRELLSCLTQCSVRTSQTLPSCPSLTCLWSWKFTSIRKAKRNNTGRKIYIMEVLPASGSALLCVGLKMNCEQEPGALLQGALELLENNNPQWGLKLALTTNSTLLEVQKLCHFPLCIGNMQQSKSLLPWILEANCASLLSSCVDSTNLLSRRESYKI